MLDIIIATGLAAPRRRQTGNVLFINFIKSIFFCCELPNFNCFDSTEKIPDCHNPFRGLTVGLIKTMYKNRDKNWQDRDFLQTR